MCLECAYVRKTFPNYWYLQMPSENSHVLPSLFIRTLCMLLSKTYLSFSILFCIKSTNAITVAISAVLLCFYFVYN